MKIHDLRGLFEIELWYTNDCEQKLLDKGLPTMIEGCQSSELRMALEHHLKETSDHVLRLQQVFSITGTKLDTRGNSILKEMMGAAKDSINHIDSSPLRDAALILNGHQIEHYEIAIYGSLIAFARKLGFNDAIALLEQTLREEKAADATLTQIAETAVNSNASQGSRRAMSGI